MILSMCLRQPFQLLTSSPIPVKDNTRNNNEKETFATNDKKQQQQQKKLKLDEISAIKTERKKDGNKQTK